MVVSTISLQSSTFLNQFYSKTFVFFVDQKNDPKFDSKPSNNPNRDPWSVWSVAPLVNSKDHALGHAKWNKKNDLLWQLLILLSWEQPAINSAWLVTDASKERSEGRKIEWYVVSQVHERRGRHPFQTFSFIQKLWKIVMSGWWVNKS